MACDSRALQLHLKLIEIYVARLQHLVDFRGVIPAHLVWQCADTRQSFDIVSTVAPDIQVPTEYRIRLGGRSNCETQWLDYFLVVEVNDRVRIGIGEFGVAVGDAHFHTIDNEAQVACATENLIGYRRCVFTNLQPILAVVTDDFGLERVVHTKVSFCQQSRRNA